LATSKKTYFVLAIGLVAIAIFAIIKYQRPDETSAPAVKQSDAQKVESTAIEPVGTGSPENPINHVDTSNNAAGEVRFGQIRLEWQELKREADSGSPASACKLYKVLEDCRFNEDVTKAADGTITALASGAKLPNGEKQVIELQKISGKLSSACSAIPKEMYSEYPKYLLQAALAGHEPSMFQYVTDPGIDAERPLENLDALRAYRDNAPRLVDLLLQNGSTEALSLAFAVANGNPFVSQSPVRARNPLEVIRLGTALQLATTPRARIETSIGQAMMEVDRQAASKAKSNGQADAKKFNRKFSTGPNGDASPSSTLQECDGLSNNQR